MKGLGLRALLALLTILVLAAGIAGASDKDKGQGQARDDKQQWRDSDDRNWVCTRSAVTIRMATIITTAIHTTTAMVITTATTGSATAIGTEILRAGGTARSEAGAIAACLPARRRSTAATPTSIRVSSTTTSTMSRAAFTGARTSSAHGSVDVSY